MRRTSDADSPTVIIGAGQAGLATGYHLRRHGRPFVILEELGAHGEVSREDVQLIERQVTGDVGPEPAVRRHLRRVDHDRHPDTVPRAAVRRR